MKKRIFEVLYFPRSGGFKVNSMPGKAEKHCKTPVPSMLYTIAHAVGRIINENIKTEYRENVLNMVINVMKETMTISEGGSE